MRHPLKTLLALLLISVSGPLYAADVREIYLVRHAEKASDGTRNPPLTDIGQKRANNIAQVLKTKAITAVYSTDYKRTQQTAAPLAKLLGLEVQSYNPRELEAFAQKMKKTKGNILIVGHSNTTPSMAFLLGGHAMGDIDEVEYDRLYQLKMANGKVATQIIRTEPIQTRVKIAKLKVKSDKFYQGVSKFRMTMRGKPVGEAVHRFSRSGNVIKLHEKATIEAMNVNTDINVSVDANTLMPISMTMSGSMGEPADIQLTWKDGQVKGHSLMSREMYKRQGKINVNRAHSSGVVERSALLMLAHLVELEAGKTTGIQWYNAYDDEITHIELSLQGEEKVTVPAGTFDTYKIRYQGGAPSQLFYVAKGDQPKVVKIEVLTTPFVYELVE
jgi:broad specificity phosphatase PhoE